MSTTFAKPVNNFKTTLASTHSSGSGTLALASVTGLGSLGANQVFRVTVSSAPNSANETILGIFEATGISGSSLTGVTAVEGFSDTLITSGASVQVRATAKTFSDLQTAVNTLEAAASTYALDSAVVHKTGDETIAGTKTFSTTIQGNISGSATTATTATTATNVSGTVAILNGGTGATSASNARTNLGLVIGTDVLAPNGNGASLTGLNASALASGTVATARLGSGTADATTYLRGDNTWASVSVSPGGSSGQLQYNDAGAFAGASWSVIATSGTLLGITAPAVADVPLSITPKIGTATITNVAITSGVATVTTSAAHGFVAGRLVVISGATPSGLDGRWTIISVPTSTTFTASVSTGNSGSAASSGTASSVTSTGYPLRVMDAGSVAGVRINPGAGAVSVATGGTSTGYIPTYHIEVENNAAQADSTTLYRGWLSYNITNTRNRDAARIALRAGTNATAKDAAAIDLGIFGSGGTIDLYCGGNHGGTSMTKVLALTSVGANFPVNLTIAGTAGAFSLGPYNSADPNGIARLSNQSGSGKILILQCNKGVGATSLLEIQNTDDASSAIYGRIDGNYRWQIGSGTMSGAMLGVLADAAGTAVINVCGTASQTAPLITLAGESSTTARQPIAVVNGSWADSTHATRKGRYSVWVAGAAATNSNFAAGTGWREALRIEENGTCADIIIPIANVREAADDAAAAALSPPVPVGGLYRTGSFIKIRVS